MAKRSGKKAAKKASRKAPRKVSRKASRKKTGARAVSRKAAFRLGDVLKALDQKLAALEALRVDKQEGPDVAEIDAVAGFLRQAKDSVESAKNARSVGFLSALCTSGENP